MYFSQQFALSSQFAIIIVSSRMFRSTNELTSSNPYKNNRRNRHKLIQMFTVSNQSLKSKNPLVQSRIWKKHPINSRGSVMFVSLEVSIQTTRLLNIGGDLAPSFGTKQKISRTKLQNDFLGKYFKISDDLLQSSTVFYLLFTCLYCLKSGNDI